MHGGFNAEQAAQLYLKATLLEPVGDFPRRRSVLYLLGARREAVRKALGELA
jgi:HEPN domain-containing protein